MDAGSGEPASGEREGESGGQRMGERAGEGGGERRAAVGESGELGAGLTRRAFAVVTPAAAREVSESRWRWRRCWCSGWRRGSA